MTPDEARLTQWIANTRRAVEAWNRVDLDAFLETWHPECEWRPAFPKSLEGVGTVYRGRAGIARAWDGVRAVWDEYILEPESAEPIDNRLVVLGHVRARGKTSDLAVDSGWSAMVAFREGLAVTAWDWLDRDEARRAADVEAPTGIERLF